MGEYISNKVVDFILSHDFPIYENMNFYDNQYRSIRTKETLNEVLQHNTYPLTLNAIIEEGLTTKTQTSNCFIWGVNPHYVSSRDRERPLRERWRMSGSSVIFRVPKDTFIERENDSEYGIYGDVPPENIVNIDLLLTDEDNIWLSDIPFVIKEYGLNTIKRVCYRDDMRPYFLTKDQFYALFNYAIDNTSLLYN